ncbi:MAG: VPLPA-CTERM sorting domain-containing protein [Gammaproteobacteria bacterium]|nr:VPLPA-CTERM sorting domain-containing protein [Gammaproteobacteria bacterium]
MKKYLGGICLALWCCGSVQAELLSRAGGQAYYDTVLDITWVADANLAQTSGYDDNGLMSWSAAQAWITSLNTAAYLGKSDWRLPTVIDTGTPGCDLAYTGTDCGHNVDLSTGEMAHLYYSTLGNVGYYNTSGSPTGCPGDPNYCLTSTGPFSNLQPYFYWSGTVYAPAPGSRAWYFHFGDGLQFHYFQSNAFFAWAVRSGDIVPVPAAVWLFGSAMGVFGMVRRRVLAGAGA